MEVPRLQGGDDPLGVGTAAQAHTVYFSEQRRGGDGEFRLAQHRPALGQRGQGGEDFSPPFGQGGAAQDAVGHVGAHPLPNLGHLPQGQGRPLHLVQRPKDGGGVAAPPGHAGADGNTFLNGNLQPPGDLSPGLPPAQSGLGGQIFLVIGQKV